MSDQRRTEPLHASGDRGAPRKRRATPYRRPAQMSEGVFIPIENAIPARGSSKQGVGGYTYRLSVSHFRQEGGGYSTVEFYISGGTLVRQSALVPVLSGHVSGRH